MTINFEETFTVSNNIVQLSESPLSDSPLIVFEVINGERLTEVFKEPGEKEFFVNYETGLITFNPIKNQQEVKVRYTSKPEQYFNFQNIITKYVNGEASETYTYQYNYPVTDESRDSIQENFNPFGEPLHQHEIEDIINLPEVLNQKSDKNHTHSEYYTKEEVDQRIMDAIGNPPQVPVIGISFKTTDFYLQVGNVIKLEAFVLPENADNKTVEWNSSNTTIATVTSDGEVKAIVDGQVTITATTVDGGFTASANIIIESSLLYYNFRNRNGSVENIILDEYMQLPATLNNVAHDDQSGFVNDLGVMLTSNSFVTIPTSDSSLPFDINNGGLTLVVSLHNPIGAFYKTNSGKVVSFFLNGIIYAYFKYIDGTGTEKSLSMADDTGNKLNSNFTDGYRDVILNGEENVFIVTLKENGEGQMYLNGYVSEIYKANDFVEWVNTLKNEDLLLRRNHLNANTPMTILSSFEMYDRAFTEEEMLRKNQAIKDAEPFRSFQVLPTDVVLQVGESQTLAVQTYPAYYKEHVTLSYESGNEGFVKVSESGTLTGISTGETQVTVKLEYEGETYYEYINVKVGGNTAEPPAPNRSINGISLNRQTDSLDVGEEFPLMATTLPFDVYDSNYIIWETSDASIASVPYGVLTGRGAGTATITAYDSSKTYSASFEVTVKDGPEETISEEDTYMIDIHQFQIYADRSNPVQTTNGIQAVFDYAINQEFKKIVFPKGNYSITPDARTILPPSHMIVDWSDSMIYVEPSTKTASGYTMFYYDGDVEHCTFENGHFFGEAKSTTLQQSSEGCLTFEIKESYKCTWKNCTFNESPGFNVITGTNLVKKETRSISVGLNWEDGSIGEDGLNNNDSTSGVWRYQDYLDVRGLGDYYMLGYNQGYYSYPHLRSRLYSIYFYDINKNFIKQHTYNLQFFNYAKPSNASFARVVIYQENKPSTMDTDFNACAFIRTVGMPRYCKFLNCKFENNFSTGLALTGGEGWLVDGCSFRENSNGRTPACDVDWEDGWETMQGDVFRNNTVASRNGLIISAGNSLAIHDNIIDQSHLQVYSRTNNFRIYNNTFYGRGNRRHFLAAQAESYFARNILFNGASYTTSLHHPDAHYRVNDENNIII
ncbi:Ig-like domain-containing protein [Halobacillus sp. SY10]|uniref:Ig-like domain-containing protein n=1 Tax=Halobacillus sp. SY10 TaxID=3381356 RepID=UPI00387A2B3D